MPLSVTTDLTTISAAETSTGWGFFGSGADSTTLETDFFAQGTTCISVASSGTGTVEGEIYDAGVGGTLNFSTTHAGKLVYIWVRTSTPGFIDTRAAGGMRIIIGSGTTRPQAAAGAWSAWYVDGSDTWVGTDGWKCYVIDPRMTASLTQGGGLDLTAARWFGAAERNTGTLKGQNFGVDAVRYGFGELRCNGTNTNEGAGFKEMVDADFGTIGNRYGITLEKEGVFFVQGRLVIGDNSGSAATDFTSQDETLVWNYPVYYAEGRERPCMNDYRDDGTPYFGVTLVGNGTGNTNVTFGAKVGIGDTASGRSGPSLIGSRHPTGFKGDDGSVENVYIYGTTFSRFRAGIDLSGNASSDEFIGNTVSRSGTIQSGPVVIRNCSFIDNIGGAYKTYEDFINARTVGAEALATADPKYDWSNVLNGSNLSVPSASVGYVRLLAAATQRNVVQINLDAVGADNHYADAIVRFPTGSNQGTIGVTIRGASGTTENYYFLRLDRPNNQVTLIRCDGGTDTTIAGPTSMTLSADTDYLVNLYGSGTTIEGFVSGNGTTTKLSATGQSSYQTNRRVGIRGTTNGSQSANAEPRLRRFGAGPVTDSLGSVRMPAIASSQDVKYCSFINNARATSVTASDTHSYTGHSFSGNLVGVRNSSGGAVTINVASGDSPVTAENEGSGTTTFVTSYPINTHVQDEDGADIPNAQVFIRKAGDYYDYTSHNTNNVAGDATFDVNETVDTDLPQSGWLHVWENSGNTKQDYRYQSWSGTTFTLYAELTGTADPGGSPTTLVDAGGNFTTINIREGDTIRNTSDTGAWATVDEIVSATQLTTTALQGGSSNTWANGNTWSLHRLALTYNNQDKVDIPLVNLQTNTGGDVSTTFGGSVPASIQVSIRSNQGTPKYIPFSTSGIITGDGYNLTAVLTLDTVAT